MTAIDNIHMLGMQVTDVDIAQWEALRGEGMESAVGEYTPPEFWLLLDEVKRLRTTLRQSGAVAKSGARWGIDATHDARDAREEQLRKDSELLAELFGSPSFTLTIKEK